MSYRNLPAQKVSEPDSVYHRCQHAHSVSIDGVELSVVSTPENVSPTKNQGDSDGAPGQLD